MLGHRSSANLLATSSYCVRTALLLFPYPHRKINCTYLSPHYLAEVKKQSTPIRVFSAFWGFCYECWVSCVVSGDRTLVTGFTTLVTQIKTKHLPVPPHLPLRAEHKRPFLMYIFTVGVLRVPPRRRFPLCSLIGQLA